ncbi:MAG: cohesin domain-containing protein, partial [Saprospiraceae bacterium]
INQNFGCSFNVGVSVKDQVFYTNDSQSCYKIVRRWRLVYWCHYDPSWSPWIILNPIGTDVGPTVEGTWDNSGYLEYKQIIKVLDTDLPVVLDCPDTPLVFCDYSTNDPDQYHDNHIDYCEGEVDLHITANDSCSGTDLTVRYLLFLDMNNDGVMETQVSSADAGAWPIALNDTGTELEASVDFPPGVGLPYGNHKIKWIVGDHCGNETVCEYPFSVEDCSPPTVVCIQGLSTNIMQTGMISIADSLLLEYTFDNCTPTSDLEWGIVKTSQSTGVFPAGQHAVTFDCFELGLQEVEVWVQDAYGNADYCQTYVLVEDNMGSCTVSGSLSGQLLTMQQQPIPNAQVAFKNAAGSANLSAQSDSDGVFEFSAIPVGCDYTLVPDLDLPVKEGVTVLDALLTAAHAQEILPLTSPYQLMAADVDGSGSLDNQDAMSIAQAGIGAVDVFPGVSSWIFMDANLTFSDPENPWSEDWLASFCLDPGIDFAKNMVALKAGDVNQSASLDAVNSSDRKEDQYLYFSAPAVAFEAGQTIQIPVDAPDVSTWPAFQFTLQYDATRLQLVDVSPGLVPEGLLARQDASGTITCAWYEAALLNAQGKGEGETAFTLVFEALDAGNTQDALQINSEQATAIAYTQGLQGAGVLLRFVSPMQGARLLAPSPNPVVDRLLVRWDMPASGPVVLSLIDVNGQRCTQWTGEGSAGRNTQWLDIPERVTQGLMFLRLETNQGTAVQKVMKK